jgi:hypothetical protein
MLASEAAFVIEHPEKAKDAIEQPELAGLGFVAHRKCRRV